MTKAPAPPPATSSGTASSGKRKRKAPAAPQENDATATMAELEEWDTPHPDTQPDATEDETEVDALSPEAFGLRGTLAGRWHQLSHLPLTMMIASLLLGLGIIQMTFQLGNSIYRSVTWNHETQATLGRVQHLQRDINILHAAEQAATDPSYLEQLARCQGFVSSSEKVVVASSAPTTPPGESCVVIRLP